MYDTAQTSRVENQLHAYLSSKNVEGKSTLSYGIKSPFLYYNPTYLQQSTYTCTHT